MAQYMRPDGDDAQSGDWEPEPSDTTLWDVIDESSPNDSDYAWHNAIVVGEYFRVTLSNPAETPDSSGTHTMKFRASKIDGAKLIKVKLELRQGSTTVIATKETYFLEGVIDDFISTLSQEQVDNITDYNDLRFHFECTAVIGTGKSSDPAIYWAEFEVPDAGVLYVPKIIGII